MSYSDEQISQALEKLETSAGLAESPRLCSLLRYLVGEVQAGRGERLKGYTIGVEVFGKGEDFDPVQDSLVRVQMSRLRSAIDAYYAGPGSEDDPRLVLEAGDYAPRFEAPEVPAVEDSGAPEMPSAASVREVRWLLALALVIVLAIIAWPWLDGFDDPIGDAAERPDGPVIMVAAFPATGPDAEIADGLRDGLQHDLITNLAQLPHIGVIGFDSVAEQEFADVTQAQGEADFLLVGTVTLDRSSFRVNSNLVRTRDGVVVWSQSTDSIPLTSGNFLDAQTDIAVSVAAELGQPYGAVHEAMRMDAENHDSVALQYYFCELDVYDYMRTKDPEERVRVRDCLERAVGESPDYSDAWALLAWIYGDDARLGGEVDMERSLFAAEQAVRSNPTSALAYSQLGLAHFFSGNDEASVDAFERALRLAPNDTEILANAAWVLAMLDDDPDAQALALKAIDLNPGHPPWYWLGIVITELRDGDAENAVRAANLYAREDTPLPAFLQAAAYFRAGEEERSREALLRAGAGSQLDRGQITQELETWRLPDDIEELVLEAAGS